MRRIPLIGRAREGKGRTSRGGRHRGRSTADSPPYVAIAVRAHQHIELLPHGIHRFSPRICLDKN
ncbi:hypothetical protein SLEP1_g51402 [Rubroshorea leprosula]|uniref:Uncharacterized protein n=1 Tax=Rubroshorea leprosula TaxID=152421 RepID=A0AAV5M5P1_9ROSI|nr:hypothetical protein SLEP1_g51402 [Rubroshorea leprosula]